MTNLYRDESSDPKNNALRNLQDRTHYVDPDTLRYFHSRIISAKAAADGLLFAIVTSDAADHENRTRGFRYVIFDLFGTVVERNPSNLDIPFFKTSDKARKARDEALATIDAKALTLAAIEKAKRQFASEMEQLTKQVEMIQAVQS